jgi:hypothetical protein
MSIYFSLRGKIKAENNVRRIRLPLFEKLEGAKNERK